MGTPTVEMLVGSSLPGVPVLVDSLVKGGLKVPLSVEVLTVLSRGLEALEGSPPEGVLEGVVAGLSAKWMNRSEEFKMYYNLKVMLPL